MTYIKTAVIGVGYLGRYHADKYAQLPESRLLAVVDINTTKAQAIGMELGVEALTDYHDLLGRVDAVSIVVPTPWHYPIARDFLEHGCHVLVEKPMTSSLEEAQSLIDLAKEYRRVLQIGHLERFNTAILGLHQIVNKPQFIESHRLAPFKPRGTEISVVMDLMIHDIDIILNIVGAGLQSIDASGVPVLTSEVDIANARLVFENGCVANVTASRVSLKTERKMRLFQHDAYISVDFHNRELAIHRKGLGEMFPGIPNIEVEKTQYEDGDALKTEIKMFLQSIRDEVEPIVTGEDGKQALETAMRISTLLARPTPH